MQSGSLPQESGLTAAGHLIGSASLDLRLVRGAWLAQVLAPWVKLR